MHLGVEINTDLEAVLQIMLATSRNSRDLSAITLMAWSELYGFLNDGNRLVEVAGGAPNLDHRGFRPSSPLLAWRHDRTAPSSAPGRPPMPQFCSLFCVRVRRGGRVVNRIDPRSESSEDLGKGCKISVVSEHMPLTRIEPG